MNVLTWVAALLLTTGYAASVIAQPPNAKEKPTSSPAQENAPSNNGDADLVPQPASVPAARVIEVAGVAHWAPAGTSPLAQKGWTAIRVDDSLTPGTLIRTGLRSHVNLQFGQTTTVSVRSASYASIDQFYREATTETVRVGLGYGTIRGGSSEGKIRADVEVTAPVATLAKRGTEGWEISVEPGTGRFRISLAERGLVEAIKTASGRRIASRTVRPGQYATNTSIANLWINQDIFDRNISFYDAHFLTLSDAEFLASNTGSFSTLEPGGGTDLVKLSGRFNRPGQLIRRPGVIAATTLLTLPIGVSGPSLRPEGNFGTGGIFKRR